MSAWEEIQDEEKEEEHEPETAEPEVPLPSDEPGQEDEEEAEEEEDAEAPGPEEDEDEDEAEDEDEGEEHADESVSATYEDDPEIQAYLAKYGGDLDQALRGAAELQRVLGRQGSEKAALAERVAELEGYITQQRAFAPDANFLTPEQQAWVEEAMG